MKTVQRTSAFIAWLRGLRDKAGAARIATAIDKLAIGLGDVKSVGGGVHELRLHFGPGYRLYFTERDGTIILLLCGGDKSTQAKDIKAAKALMRGLQD